ncbi:MAG: TonB-dependent receptor [Dysgonamonadaceae bacterium]|jgi:TonB-linked SusC/RagA family outer membrane protein|nr:TonB-dependent receptor [Dysgonamonadaceae bacterium]
MTLISKFMLSTLMFISAAAMAVDASAQQSRTIRGVVTDENNEYVTGATVTVPGTSIGTVSDGDGKFELLLPDGKTTVQVSFLGYKTQVIQVGKSATVDVALIQDSRMLDEVVAIGYGTVKKRDLTGAITTVKGSDLTLNPHSDPMQALQGKVAGLDITKESGKAGEEIKMQLRGTRSFTAKGDPTFIIDGMPGNYSSLNPNDIESIEVLKDAASTAIYGSSGSNGVILITTKSGAAGRTSVSLNSYIGVNGWSQTPKMRSGESYIQAIRDANAATGNWSSPADDERVLDGVLGQGAYAAHQKGQYVDWAGAVLQNNLTQNYSLAVSGGNEKTTAYFSLNFSDEAGQYVGDDYKLYSSNIRIDHSVKKWLKIGLNSQLSYVHRNDAYANLENAFREVPLGSLRDENGKLNVMPSIGGTWVNILLDTEDDVYKNQTQKSNLYFNPYIEIIPVKGLSIISRIGASLSDSRRNYFQGIGSYQYYTAGGQNTTGTNANVYAEVKEERNYNYKWENILTYNFKLMEDHDFTFTGVTTWNHNRYDKIVMKETNITDNNYLWHNMGARGAENSTVESSYTMSKGLGLIGRLAYSYKSRYLFSASVRREASSVLAANNRWDTFPAASIGWRLSDESFMESTKNWLDDLKFRVGYGITGTANIAPYSSQSNIELSTMGFSGGIADIYRFSENYANKNLGWEKSYNTNIGLDLSLFNNRINLIADYYDTDTKGIIWKRSLPVNNGAFTSDKPYVTSMNICETNNHGFELALNTRNIVTKDFNWSSSLTFNRNNEKIVSLIEGVADNITNGATGFSLSMGHPVNSFYNYKIDGVWQKGEEADAAVFGAKPGDLKINVPGLVRESSGLYYKIDEATGDKVVYDVDNKYTVSGEDYQVLGHNSPDWSLGFQNTFTYRNFDLSVFVYARWGQMIKYNLLGNYDPSGKMNFPEYFDYWTESNPSNDFPAINAGMSISNYIGASALQYVDGSFLKIKNITLGYTIPSNILNKVGISKCRFYGTITNPLVIANSRLLQGYDPEMNGTQDFPLTKQLVFGVNLSF